MSADPSTTTGYPSLDSELRREAARLASFDAADRSRRTGVPPAATEGCCGGNVNAAAAAQQRPADVSAEAIAHLAGGLGRAEEDLADRLTGLQMLAGVATAGPLIEAADDTRTRASQVVDLLQAAGHQARTYLARADGYNAALMAIRELCDDRTTIELVDLFERDANARLDRHPQDWVVVRVCQLWRQRETARTTAVSLEAELADAGELRIRVAGAEAQLQVLRRMLDQALRTDDRDGLSADQLRQVLTDADTAGQRAEALAGQQPPVPLWEVTPPAEGEPLRIRDVLAQMVGAGSTCWTGQPVGVFDDRRAVAIVDAGVEAISGLLVDGTGE